MVLRGCCDLRQIEAGTASQPSYGIIVKGLLHGWALDLMSRFASISEAMNRLSRVALQGSKTGESLVAAQFGYLRLVGMRVHSKSPEIWREFCISIFP